MGLSIVVRAIECYFGIIIRKVRLDEKNKLILYKLNHQSYILCPGNLIKIMFFLNIKLCFFYKAYSFVSKLVKYTEYLAIHFNCKILLQ